MKKIILGLSGLFVLAFVVILFVNAQGNPKEVKKVSTEMSKDCGACPSASAAVCATKADTKTADVKKCDPAKCKEGKCDPATCKANCTAANGAMKKCDPAMCTGMAKK